MRRLISILLFILVCLPSVAQTDRKEVRAGNRKFSKDKYKESEIDYRKAVLKDSTSVAGQYNLASSLYRQGDYDGAGVALGRVEESGRPDVLFNAGDVALQKRIMPVRLRHSRMPFFRHLTTWTPRRTIFMRRRCWRTSRINRISSRTNNRTSRIIRITRISSRTSSRISKISSRTIRINRMTSPRTNRNQV